MDESLADEARRLGVNVSAAARAGVAAAVLAAQLERDRAAYLANPERADEFWTDAETWSAE
jgi:post-segregation antitoxin (ccd killing protein)